MMRIRWTPAAADDLETIVLHIRQENPDAAQQIARAIFHNLQKLLTFPSMGRRGKKAGTRELVVSPYIIVYRVTQEFIEPLRIWHGAQDWHQ